MVRFPPMWLYVVAVFVSAFLLFQVQPLTGKTILPWFGSSAAVWTTSLLFFQTVLLVGYAYAHFVGTRLTRRPQAVVHVAVAAGALLLLPIVPYEGWKPGPEENPLARILLLLTATVGGPFLVLSATSPLLQRWFAFTHGERSVYRLYAVSNAGSLLALVSYPVLVERFLPLSLQAWIWSAGFVGSVGLVSACAWGLARSRPATTESVSSGEPSPGRPGTGRIALWLLLAACASILLMATINRMGQDVPAVPFLLVLPLALYLLTFVITFDHPRWYARPVFLVLLFAGIALALLLNREWGLTAQIAAYAFTLFACCMSCHGELARAKPDPAHLTLFYMTVALGGALGGAFVAVVAPSVFSDLWEYEIGLFGSLGAVLLALGRPVTRLAGAVALVGVVARTGLVVAVEPDDVIARSRNFYGVLRVVEQETDNPRIHNYALYHSGIRHGFQYRHEEKRRWPTAYFGVESGAGIALMHHPRRARRDGPFRMGVIGLGTGTLAAYADPGDEIRYYEIDPAVVDVAEEHFTFLGDARARGANVDVRVGDARIVMERDVAEGRAVRFDVLAIDAFSGDTIPMHLLTRECLRIYLEHLEPDGILIVHATNLYLDLLPVIRALAEEAGMEWREAFYPGDPRGNLASRWILVTSNAEFLASDRVRGAVSSNPAPDPILWTDDFSSLLPLVVD